MEQRPVLQLQKTLLQKIFNIASWMLMIAAVIWLAIHYSALPQIVPSHFDAAGNVDDHSDKIWLWLLPALGIVLISFINWLSGKPHWFNYLGKITEANAEAEYTSAVTMMKYLQLVLAIIMLMVTVVSLKASQGIMNKGPVWLLPVIIILSMSPLIFLFKSKKNK